MGQVSSSSSSCSIPPASATTGERDLDEGRRCPTDLISELPDECLACIFQSLGPGDRKRCSLVCKRWLRVEGQSRQRLSLDATSHLLTAIPSLFVRFDRVSKLALKCDRRMLSINDEALALVAVHCPSLTKLKLKACRELTDAGIEAFAKHCPALRKLSCASCTFGARGMNSVLRYCPALEELSIKRLRGLADGTAQPIGPPPGCSTSLRTICLKELYNGQCFSPLIAASKSLRNLRLYRCSGDWDRLLEAIAAQVQGLVEVHLERLQVSDRGLLALAGCADLEVLHLVKTPECTNAGLAAVADCCRMLRKLHIDGWKTNRIGDDGLVAVARKCKNLQELVLIGVNPTSASLSLLATNCLGLERLALCGSETIGDVELSCIAAKCASLRKLCIKGCPVSDQGMEALAAGCPNLVKVKVKKCRGVTSEGAEWLRASRGSLAVNLDTHDPPDASTSDCVPEHLDRSVAATTALNSHAPLDAPVTTSSGRSALSKARLVLHAGKSFMACTFMKWSISRSSQ